MKRNNQKQLLKSTITVAAPKFGYASKKNLPIKEENDSYEERIQETTQAEYVEIFMSSDSSESEDKYSTEMLMLNKTIDDKYLEKDSNPYRCSICPSEFHLKENLNAHIKNHFLTYECGICKKKLIGDTQYEYHISTNHKRNYKKLSLPSTQHSVKLEVEPYLAKSLLKSCKFCNVKFHKKSELLEHVKKGHAVESLILINCDVCGRLCRNASALKAHKLTHSNIKSFICDYCGKGFTKKTNLEFHIRTHTGERPMKCDMCPKAFAHISGLICHKRTHTGERPYKCPFCERAYSHSTDLRRHRRTHGGEEKRFACTLCDRKFFEKKFLLSHMKIHTKNNSIKPDIDYSRFLTPGILK